MRFRFSIHRNRVRAEVNNERHSTGVAMIRSIAEATSSVVMDVRAVSELRNQMAVDRPPHLIHRFRPVPGFVASEEKSESFLEGHLRSVVRNAEPMSGENLVCLLARLRNCHDRPTAEICAPSLLTIHERERFHARRRDTDGKPGKRAVDIRERAAIGSFEMFECDVA